MITETFAAKAALYVGATAIGYLALDKFCDNAGIQEPISCAARAGVNFCKKLSRDFNTSSEERALIARAEMAARTAYAEVLAANTTIPGPVTGSTPCTK